MPRQRQRSRFTLVLFVLLALVLFIGGSVASDFIANDLAEPLADYRWLIWLLFLAAAAGSAWVAVHEWRRKDDNAVDLRFAADAYYYNETSVPLTRFFR